MSYRATFTPQAWVRDYAIEVDPEGETEWHCTAGVASMPDDYRQTLLAEMADHGEALDGWDWLKGDPDAPEWVRAWSGPFSIYVREGGPVMTIEERVSTALDIANDYGGFDGGHHKMWVIDQMVRALTDCPTVTLQNHLASTPDGKGFMTIEYEGFGESDEYTAWVAAHNDGEDGPNTYAWDTGIAP